MANRKLTKMFCVINVEAFNRKWLSDTEDAIAHARSIFRNHMNERVAASTSLAVVQCMGIVRLPQPKLEVLRMEDLSRAEFEAIFSDQD